MSHVLGYICREILFLIGGLTLVRDNSFGFNDSFV